MSRISEELRRAEVAGFLDRLSTCLLPRNRREEGRRTSTSPSDGSHQHHASIPLPEPIFRNVELGALTIAVVESAFTVFPTASPESEPPAANITATAVDITARTRTCTRNAGCFNRKARFLLDSRGGEESADGGLDEGSRGSDIMSSAGAKRSQRQWVTPPLPVSHI